MACSYISYLPCLYVFIWRSKIDLAGNALSHVGQVKSCSESFFEVLTLFLEGDVDGESNGY